MDSPNLEDLKVSSTSAHAPVSRAAPSRQGLMRLLHSGALSLHVQPVRDTRTGAWVAAEALMRSRDPDFPHVGVILDAADAYGLALPLQRAVSEMAAGVRARLPAEINLLVNLCGVVLDDADAFSWAMEPLARHGESVILEITERQSLPPDSAWRPVVARAWSMGFRIALDDVGAAFSSLTTLAELAPDILKIDGALIHGAETCKRKTGLIELLSQYAHRTGATIVAEQVERQQEADLCIALGIDWLQGNLLGRPAPVDTWFPGGA